MVFGSLAWLALCLAPESTIEPVPEANREPDVPTAVVAPADQAMPVVIGLEPPAAPSPPPAGTTDKPAPTDADEDAPPILPEMVSDAALGDMFGESPPTEDLPPIGTNPSTPRVLATMNGYPRDEQASIAAKKHNSVFVPGLQLRNQVGFLGPFTLDDEGNRFSEGAFSSGRFRWRPELVLGNNHRVKLVAMVDIASGRWAPQGSDNPILQEIVDDGKPPVPMELRAVDPRELYIQWTTKAGELRLGQMAFTWGQGLVANDGNNQDRFGDLKFGNDGDGGINERVVFATRPLARGGGPGQNIVFALGVDLVYRDPHANLLEGDLAGQGFFVVRWEPEHRPGNWIGGYAIFRHQKSADDVDIYRGDDQLTVGVADFAGQGTKKLRAKLSLVGAFEATFIGGRTTFAADPGQTQQVIQAAAALRGFIGDPLVWLIGFDAGYASGDANPDDNEVNDFKAAPGYNAGLVLFDYVHGWQSARSQIQAEDTTLFGVADNGTQYIPSGGSVTNVVYVHPKIRYGMWEKAEVWAGPLVAGAPASIVDPYTTKLGGGSPRNARGGTGDERYWGTELDFGVRVRHAYHRVWLQAGVQAGVLFPGPAFDDAVGDRDGTIWGTWFRSEIRY